MSIEAAPPLSAQPPTPTDERPPHVITRRAIAGWWMYDLANTIFSMGVISVYFSLWVRDQVGAERADASYGIISGISMAFIFVLSPLLGAVTDRARRRMPFLVASTVVCVVFTSLLARAGFTVTAVCFIIANIAYQTGLQFYDAMLPEVSTEENRGKIGGIGVGLGYLGSYVALGLGYLLRAYDKATLFTAIGLAFLAFAIPCFLWTRERGNPNPRPITLAMAVESTRETIRTLRAGGRYPGLLRFLIGRMFYTDSINTVISIMTLYTVNVAVNTGLSEAQGQAFSPKIMGVAITCAILGGFVWGWLTDRLGPRRTLALVLTCWMAIFAGAGAVGILHLPLWTLFIVAGSAGFCLGGVWAADRPFMLRLTPPARIGEFYGLYNMVGRFSAITGPLIWAATTWVTIQVWGMNPAVGQGISVLVLMLMIVTSYFILRPVTDTPRVWEGSDLAA
ncbi:MAG TPA: MFS transporter [Longimicrobiaceae bacterium]|nr:MFS transporter [Longimicrobiaceae bacterium]